jgi:hypothetical protein
MEPILNQSFGWLIKIKTIKESRAVNEGDRFYGYYYDDPEPGLSFHFFIMSEIGGGKMLPKPFSTSKVVKLEDEYTFKTKNSVYKLITKEKMREINIDSILNERGS